MARTKQTARKGTDGAVIRTEKAGGPPVAKKVLRKPPVNPPKRKYKYQPGTVALREICRYQKSTELLIRRWPFQRLVYKILRQNNTEMQIQAAAMMGLQEVWGISGGTLWGYKFECYPCQMSHNYAKGHPTHMKNSWRKNVKKCSSAKTKLSPFQDHPSIPRGDILEKAFISVYNSRLAPPTWDLTAVHMRSNQENT